MGDIMVYGNSKIMDVYCNLLKELNNYEGKVIIHPERLHYYNMKIHNIKMEMKFFINNDFKLYGR